MSAVQYKIGIINGPNINLLGIRETEVYGKVTLRTIEANCKSLSEELGVDTVFYQSNHEGDIVDYIQENLNIFDGVIINPAAFTKTGYAILDALTAINLPFVEVHLTNIIARGSWHADSIFTSKAIGSILGFQENVYELALRAMCNYLKKNKRRIEGERLKQRGSG